MPATHVVISARRFRKGVRLPSPPPSIEVHHLQQGDGLHRHPLRYLQQALQEIQGRVGPSNARRSNSLLLRALLHDGGGEQESQAPSGSSSTWIETKRPHVVSLVHRAGTLSQAVRAPGHHTRVPQGALGLPGRPVPPDRLGSRPPTQHDGLEGMRPIATSGPAWTGSIPRRVTCRATCASWR